VHATGANHNVKSFDFFAVLISLFEKSLSCYVTNKASIKIKTIRIFLIFAFAISQICRGLSLPRLH